MQRHVIEGCDGEDDSRVALKQNQLGSGRVLCLCRLTNDVWPEKEDILGHEILLGNDGGMRLAIPIAIHDLLLFLRHGRRTCGRRSSSSLSSCPDTRHLKSRKVKCSGDSVAGRVFQKFDAQLVNLGEGR